VTCFGTHVDKLVIAFTSSMGSHCLKAFHHPDTVRRSESLEAFLVQGLNNALVQIGADTMSLLLHDDICSW